MKRDLIITNAVSVTSGETVFILIENGVIREISSLTNDSIISDAVSFPQLDAGGRFISPGFIDVHIHGAGGSDTIDGNREALATISKTCARFGTTAFLATTTCHPGKKNPHLAVAADATGSDLGGATLLGIHIEGPFISTGKRGMIPETSICPPSLTALDEIRSITGDALKMMTIAPELDGNLPIIRRLVDDGIIASFGHSLASYRETLRGIEAGITHVTHFFNAMASMHHREPGPILAIFQSNDLTVQLITDGVHVSPEMIAWAYGLLGEERTAVITDGTRAVGMPDGTYTYDGIQYEAKDGTARYSDGTLIGTALGQSQMMSRLIEFTGLPLQRVIRSLTETPARALGIEDRKGSIEVGKDADLVILDADLSVWATIVGGKVVFGK